LGRSKRRHNRQRWPRRATALSLNPDEPWAHAALGYASIWKRPEEAIAPCQRAIAFNPNFAVGHYFLALASTFAGHPRFERRSFQLYLAHANLAEHLASRDLLARLRRRAR